jgi:prepilin-type N-terminal cleavage/methylation domain-containing protein
LFAVSRKLLKKREAARRCLEAHTPRQRPRSPSLCQAGFSLTELLVALVAALVLIVAVASGYIVNKRSYEEETWIRDMQMNAQVAMDRIKDLVMSAGVGCKENFPPLGADTIQGAFPTRDASRVLTISNSTDGPDTLTVATGLRPVTVATCPCQREDPPTCQYCEGTVIDVGDARFFDTGTSRYLFLAPSDQNRYSIVTGVTGSQITLSNSVKWSDNAGVFRVNAYTIVLDQRPDGSAIDVDGDGSTDDGDSTADRAAYNGRSIPDLYVCDNTQDLAHEADCKVAQGIEDVQFQYGWDADGDGSIDDAEFLDAPAVSDEEAIRSVRIWILARTLLPDPGFTDENTSYTLADHTIDLTASPDPDARHYHRYLLVETVLIRNRNL